MRPGKRHFDATDAQLRLLDTWLQQGENMALSWIEDQERKAQKARDSINVYQTYSPDPRYNASPAQVMAKAQYQGLCRASTYWVSSDMVQTIEMSLKDLPDAPLTPMDLPTPSGFAFLDRPIYLPSQRDTLMNVQAIAWFPSYMDIPLGDGTTAMTQSMNVTYYSNTRDEEDTDWPDDLPAERRRQMGVPPLVLLATHSMPWRMTGEIPADPEGRMDILEMPDTDDQYAKMRIEARVGKIGNPYDFDPMVFPEFPNDPNKRLVVEWTDATAAKFLVGLWRFTTQKVTRVSQRPYDNPTRKRIIRCKHHVEWGDVRTIDLRAYTYPDGTRRPASDDDEAWTHWSHRWRVSPFWRRQWYPSEQRHKWVYIETYIKGPEHLPLVEKDDIRRVIR